MNLKELLKLALKNKEQVKINTLRLLISDVEKIEKSNQNNQEVDLIKIIQKAINSRKESLSFYKDGNKDLEEEIIYLETFLPKQLTEFELEQIIQAIIIANNFNGIKDMKNLMSLVSSKVKGQCDSKLIGKNCKNALS